MKQWIYQRTVDAGGFWVHRLERLIAWGSKIGNPAFFDRATFAWVADLERGWPTIRQELDVVLERRDDLPAFHEISQDQAGLLVPEPRERCRLRVGDSFASWREGEVLLFDDTYSHEVWNDTGGVRVVLFLDVVRPLRFPANLLNALLLRLIAASPYVQDGVENYKRWEKKFDAMDVPAPRRSAA